MPDLTQETHQDYLGGGVYVAYDGHSIWLRKLDGNQIALNAPVLRALVHYQQRLEMTLTPPDGIAP